MFSPKKEDNSEDSKLKLGSRQHDFDEKYF